MKYQSGNEPIDAKTKEVTFIIKFSTPQDIEDKHNDLEKVYAKLDELFDDGIISDFNMSTCVEEES